MSGTTPPTAYVVGAGLAGLSAAIRLCQRGWKVKVLEAAGQAGGRARSYHDDQLGCRIDNGNHLLLSGNRRALAYLDTIGARDELEMAQEAAFPFVDLADGTRWTVRLNRGPIPWWIFVPGRRVAGTYPWDYFSAVKLAFARSASVGLLFDHKQPLYRRFWEPLEVAVLNTHDGAARLLWPVMTQTMGRGAGRSRPCMARSGLSETFVDPALAWLTDRGATVRFNARVRQVTLNDRRVQSLTVGDDTIPLRDADRVVLAITPKVARELVGDLTVPVGGSAIVNAHFLIETPLSLPGGGFLLGIVGGTAQWLFLRGNIASVTISAAGELAGLPAEELERRIWGDICRALNLGDAPQPPARIVKERRATFSQSAVQLPRRPGTRTRWRNLFLAGDWTATGLPATIEGAIKSGEKAARAVGRPQR